MPATRDQRTVRRILKRRGSELLFRLWAKTKDRKAGSQGWAPTATTVTARAALIPLSESTDANVKRGDSVLLVDGGPFSVDLDSDWRVEIKGEEHQIAGDVAICRTTPDGPAAYFETMIKAGAKTSGP